MLDIITAIIASIAVMAVSIYAGKYISRYKSSVTEMLGMMIGMTQGMMTGITIGYFIGAATDMFIANLVGVIAGLIFGIIFGKAGGLMGILNGGMSAVMGGMMGAMLGVMLQYLYDGWAVIITGIFMGIIFIASLTGLVFLVKQYASAQIEIDPVCKMKVNTNTSLQYSFQGKTYFFCAPSCKRAFAETPEMFLKKMEFPSSAGDSSNPEAGTVIGETKTDTTEK